MDMLSASGGQEYADFPQNTTNEIGRNWGQYPSI
jgi:hypothetical protein